MKFLNICSVIILPIFFVSCKSTTAVKSVVAVLDSLIINENVNDRFHGTIVITNNDNLIYQKAIGIANRTWDISVTHSTRFDIASLNKSFQATLIMMAVEEGKLNLTDRLQDLLKRYQYTGSLHKDITIHHMLTHTAGLPDYSAVNDTLAANNLFLFKRLHFTNQEYVDFISQLKPVGEPGRQFYYSNFSYHLLCIILEDVYQKSFNEILQEKICEPLHLMHTYAPASNNDVHENVAEAYTYLKSENRWIKNNFIDFSLGRRIYSTSSDLSKWAKSFNNPQLVNAKSLSLIKSNHLKNISADVGYGYGWVYFDGFNDYKMGNLGLSKSYLIHGGATEGFKSMLANINEGEYIISFLSNVGPATDEMGLMKQIVQILIKQNNEEE